MNPLPEVAEVQDGVSQVLIVGFVFATIGAYLRQKRARNVAEKLTRWHVVSLLMAIFSASADFASVLPATPPKARSVAVAVGMLAAVLGFYISSYATSKLTTQGKDRM